MFQDEITRIVCTRVVGDRRVLEISKVTFLPEAVASFPEPHQAAMEGESVGKAFRSRGIQFRRDIKASYSYGLPPVFARWFGTTKDAVVIDLTLRVGPDEMPYAEVLETYRPGVDWPDLEGQPSSEQRQQISLLGDFLEGRPKTS